MYRVPGTCKSNIHITGGHDGKEKATGAGKIPFNFLYPAKVSFKNKGKIMKFSSEENENTSLPTDFLEEIWKDVLQADGP